MTRPKLIASIVAGALAVGAIGILLFKSNETAAPQAPAAKAQDVDRAADTAPTQIEQAPRQTQEVFVPPPSDATGRSPPVPPPPK
jgi:hypothetical protein